MAKRENELLNRAAGNLPSRLQRDIFGNEFLGKRAVLRVSLEEADLPEGLQELISAIELMGLEEVDVSGIVSEALGVVGVEFWDEKLEELTPMEWKLFAALEDPLFRERVRLILSSR